MPMDPKLKKQLTRALRGPITAPLDTLLPGSLVLDELHRTNALIMVPPEIDRGSILSCILLQDAAEEMVWYVVPDTFLTPFRVFYLESVAGASDTTVMTYGRMEKPTGKVVIWALEVLRDSLADLASLPVLPGRVIFDEAEYLGHPEVGPAMEEVLLCLPRDISIAALMSVASDSQRMVSWMEAVRGRPCRLIQPDLQTSAPVPVFLSSQWELLPLMEKRQLTGKVKRSIKETPPHPSLQSARFVQQLLAILREENLTPALIVMPSPRDCDAAAGACTQVFRRVGEALTDPRISAFLDRYPFLKDHPLLLDALSRKAAPLHSGHHPHWCMLVEHFLMIANIDILFSTWDDAGCVMSSMRSVVMCASEQGQGEGVSNRRVDVWGVHRIKRVLGSDKAAGPGCMVVVQSADMDVVHLKELFLKTPRPLAGKLHCDCRSVLGLLAQGGDPCTLLERMLLDEQAPSDLESRLLEIIEGLSAELPERRCTFHIQSLTSLIDLRRRLTLSIGEANNDMKKPMPEWKRVRMGKDVQRMEGTIALLPCEGCSHFSLCHKRGFRKFRNLMEEYETTLVGVRHGRVRVKLDVEYIMACHRAFELADLDGSLTKMGMLALRTGLRLPQPLTECIRHGHLPSSAASYSLALAGGFVERPESEQPFRTGALEDEVEELLPDYQRMQHTLNHTAERMLRFGIPVPQFSLYQSAILLALQKGRGMESLAKELTISVGAMTRLLQRAEYVWGKAFS